MSEQGGGLAPLQVEVARVFFALKESVGFVVAGGAALLASDLITRSTEDLDLFTSMPNPSAIDSPPHDTPTMTVLGPTLAPLELASRKLLALFGRAEARDFADVYVLAQRFGRDTILKEARALDAGFNTEVLAQMLRTISRFDDGEIPLPTADLAMARKFFSAWAKELAS